MPASGAATTANVLIDSTGGTNAEVSVTGCTIQHNHNAAASANIPVAFARVGSMFGDAGLNIANMAVSRTKEGGEALMVFSIDSPATSALVDQLHAVGFDDVRFVELG